MYMYMYTGPDYGSGSYFGPSTICLESYGDEVKLVDTDAGQTLTLGLGVILAFNYLEGPSTQYLRSLVPSTFKGMVFGTRSLKY